MRWSRDCALDQGEGAELAFQVPLEVGGDQAAALTAGRGRRGVGHLPVSTHEGVEQL